MEEPNMNVLLCVISDHSLVGIRINEQEYICLCEQEFDPAKAKCDVTIRQGRWIHHPHCVVCKRNPPEYTRFPGLPVQICQQQSMSDWTE